MATIRIEFETDNAAFEDGWASECSFVLSDALVFLRAHPRRCGEKNLRDSNGNTIGHVTVKP
jgi:hypothetical protein